MRPRLEGVSGLLGRLWGGKGEESGGMRRRPSFPTALDSRGVSGFLQVVRGMGGFFFFGFCFNTRGEEKLGGYGDDFLVDC